jgi:hypothetical protein
MRNEKHHSYLTDCYDHPEYLSDILRELYGNSQNVIMESIKKEWEEFSYKESMERFLKQ